MRQWPRGIRKEAVDLWMKDAAPSRALLDAYHHAGLTSHELAARYRAEIVEERPHVLPELHKLEREHGTVTVLCFERLPPAEYCHRLTLLELLAGKPARGSARSQSRNVRRTAGSAALKPD